jgi:predicted nuclease with TOPRIM domain
MARDGPTAKTYLQPEQYERWKARADELDMSISEFIQHMVEAGMKIDRGFDVAIQPDESAHELRKQRNDMKDEVDRLRERVAELEDQVHDRERVVIERHVEDLGMASFNQILERVRETAPTRVNNHLDALSGQKIQQNQNGLWGPVTDDEGGM